MPSMLEDHSPQHGRAHLLAIITYVKNGQGDRTNTAQDHTSAAIGMAVRPP